MDAPKALIKDIEGDATTDGTTQPISQQVDPYDQLMEELKDAAAEIDTALDSMLSQITTEVPSTNIPESDLLGTLSTGISSTADSLGGGPASLPFDPPSGLI